MCYSKSWYEEAERNAREVNAKGAEQKRAGTIRGLLSDAERHAEEAKARAASGNEPAPAK